MTPDLREIDRAIEEHEAAKRHRAAERAAQRRERLARLRLDARRLRIVAWYGAVLGCVAFLVWMDTRLWHVGDANQAARTTWWVVHTGAVMILLLILLTEGKPE